MEAQVAAFVYGRLTNVPVSGVPVSGVPVSGVPVSGVPVFDAPLTDVPPSGLGHRRDGALMDC